MNDEYRMMNIEWRMTVIQIQRFRSWMPGWF